MEEKPIQASSQTPSPSPTQKSKGPIGNLIDMAIDIFAITILVSLAFRILSSLSSIPRYTEDRGREEESSV